MGNKLTIDGFEIHPRIWYYLLDWNNQDKFNTLTELYGVKKLGDLTKSKLLNLLFVATQSDIQYYIK